MAPSYRDALARGLVDSDDTTSLTKKLEAVSITQTPDAEPTKRSRDAESVKNGNNATVVKSAIQQRTFHPFPRLPQELRDMIWEMATRDTRPGVHFFSLPPGGLEPERSPVALRDGEHIYYETCRGPTPEAECRVYYNQAFYRPYLPHEIASELRFRWCGPPSSPSPSPLPGGYGFDGDFASDALRWHRAAKLGGPGAADPSTYMVDSCMWTACRDSLAAMRRAYAEVDVFAGRPGAAAEARALARRVYGSRTGRSGYCVGRGDQKERQYFTLLREDLVVLRTPRAGLRALLNLLTMTRDDGRFGGSRAGAGGGAGAGMRHFGIEYDPACQGGEEAPHGLDCYSPQPAFIATAIEMMLGRLDRLCVRDYHLWLIDYQIRRRRPSPSSPPSSAASASASASTRPTGGDDIDEDGVRAGRHVFRGQGCRFVEVRRSDAHLWELPDGRPLDGSGGPTVFTVGCATMVSVGARRPHVLQDMLGVLAVDNGS
ncbi:hypothetical protein GGR56DRAFT_693747 [Xylariaceae sp. FL0804]|nr:hypothetical protein GGR56DRAFT_693747 [Xylariaceae sp. FL0804]